MKNISLTNFYKYSKNEILIAYKLKIVNYII